jgi:hypothetical protein
LWRTLKERRESPDAIAYVEEEYRAIANKPAERRPF